MKPIPDYFHTHKYTILIGTFVLMALAAHWVSSSNEKLITHQAPNKIVSLELAWKDFKADRIAGSWEKIKQIDTAIYSIQKDFLFVITYTLFLLCCVLAMNGPGDFNRWTKIFIACIIAAFIGDNMENVFMLWFLTHHPTPAILFSLPATVKFVAIIGVIGYLVYYLLCQFKDFLKALWLYFAGILTVIISYFIFIKLTQGQDVIMQVGEYSGPFLFSILCIPLWSGYVWYSSRLIGYVKSLQPHPTIRTSFHQHFPRLMAYNAFVSLQAAILALPTICNWSEGNLWEFVLFQNALYFIWSAWLTTTHRGPTLKLLFYTALVLGISYVIVLCYQVDPCSEGHLLNKGHQFWLPMFAILLFVSQLTQAWYFIHRRKKIDLRKAAQPQAELKVMGIAALKIPDEFVASEQKTFTAFNIIGLLGIILHIGCYFLLDLTNRMGPLAVTLLSFGVLVGASNTITFFSMKANVNIFFVLFVLTFVVGRFYDPYAVRLTSAVERDVYKKRPQLDHYFWNWARDPGRARKIKASNGNFPVYLVIADGGASRSGYWVASVLSALQDSTIKEKKGDLFSDHVLCLAGASGGSLGTATFFALLKNKMNKDTVTYDYLARSRTFIGQDFLSTVIAHWMGSDFFRHLIPIPMPDRAAALELALEHFSKESLDGAFAKKLSTVLDPTGKLPILFINTTNVQRGNPAVISSVHLEQFSHRMDVLDLLDTLNGRSDFNLSTAVVMGARFPYVSPAGRIGKENFVDGGYFDNTGSGIVHEMLQYLDSMIYHNDTTLYNTLRFHLLHVSNTSLKEIADQPIHPMVNDMDSPLLTLFNTYSAQTSINDQRLVTFLRRIEDRSTDEVRTEINLYSDSTGYDYPMNWVISDYNLRRMDKRLEEVKRDHFKEVHRKKGVRDVQRAR
jgi:hypothetical protein